MSTWIPFKIFLCLFLTLIGSSTAARANYDEREHLEVHHVESSQLKSNLNSKMASISHRVAEDVGYAMGVADKLLSKAKSGLMEQMGHHFAMFNETSPTAGGEHSSSNATAVHHVGETGNETGHSVQHVEIHVHHFYDFDAEKLITMIVFQVMALFLIHKFYKPGNRFRLLSCCVCCFCWPAGWLAMCMPIDEDTKVGEPVQAGEQPRQPPQEPAAAEAQAQ
eukprot:TRINITY_DN14850_c0_g1_i1.p1 TRINITY_DN14850_c0_g1~~TRINITY_DN14850_c0_g1_i1.p1  ORF type:complete len:222 (+),score=24.38 TRINITY_DN14850_c0_g1_i1:47-712(+)